MYALAGSPTVAVDQAIDAARRALHGVPAEGVFLPAGEAGTFSALMRVPEEAAKWSTVGWS